MNNCVINHLTTVSFTGIEIRSLEKTRGRNKAKKRGGGRKGRRRSKRRKRENEK